MTPAALLVTLRCRGVTVTRDGDELVAAPVDFLTPEDVAALRASKPALLTLLADDGLDATTRSQLRDAHAHLTPRERARLEDESAAGNHLAEMMLRAVACVPEPCAWRLYSHRLDRELWVCRDARALAELEADTARNGLPVILADDLERLRGLDDLTLHAVLDCAAQWPGTRVVDAVPEPEGIT